MTASALPGGAAPRYQRLARRLEDGIARGDHPVGSLLPTEAELARLYRMSRHTVREAVRRLRDDGLVASRQGVGTVVLAARPQRGFVQTLGSVEAVMQYAAATRLVEHRLAHVVADAALAARLGWDCAGQALLRVQALRVAAEPARRPLAWTEIHLADAYAGIAERLPDLSGSLGAAIERDYGIAIAEIRQEVSAVTLAAAVATRLGASPGSPGLAVARAYVGHDGAIFLHASALHAADRFRLSMHLRREQPVHPAATAPAGPSARRAPSR